ncbi:MAG: MarR family transcriptional regulator [Phototrophicales bacterium]|nr:MAG: MarR family transcriptional regulator [Phototrophicales bacterium]
MPTHYNGTEKERLALDVYIKLARAAEAVSARVNRHLADYDLTLSQFGVLEALYHRGPLVQKDIAQKVLKSTGNITLVINNLEKRGLVVRERETEDRRFVRVHLTDAGRELVASIMPKHVAGIVEDISILSEEEQCRLAELCRKLGLREEKSE